LFFGSGGFDLHERYPQGLEQVNYTEFSGPYSGLPQVIKGDGHYDVAQRFETYRGHITDPVRFEITW